MRPVVTVKIEAIINAMMEILLAEMDALQLAK